MTGAGDGAASLFDRDRQGPPLAQTTAGARLNHSPNSSSRS